MIGAPTLLPKEQRKLLQHYTRLSLAGREQLSLFAEFLVQREAEGSAGIADQDPETAGAAPPRPVTLPRPPNETVHGAIKRLSLRYPMVDRSTLLTETASLMTAHLMHGREAAEVIDELESLFAEKHRQQSDPS